MLICWWRVCLSKDIVVSSLRRAEAGYYSAAALLLRPHGAVDVALEPAEELALVARDREVEELCLDAIPLLMQGAMPRLDSRGMLTVKSISPHAPPTWTMDVPPWIPPSCGGGMKAYPEYERAMDASVARRKKGLRPLIEDIVASYEYCSWEKAGNSESDYPGVSRE